MSAIRPVAASAPTTPFAVNTESPEVRRLIDVIALQEELLNAGSDLDETMQVATDRAQALTGAAGAAIELGEGDDMVYRVVSGTAIGSLGQRVKVAASLTGLAMTSGEILMCTDAEDDPRVDRVACRRVGLRSMICVPLPHRGESVGVLKVMSPEIDAFDGTHVAILRLLAGIIAGAMAQAQLITELHQTNELFRGLAEASSDFVVYRLAVPRERVEYISAGAGDVTGHSPEEHYADPKLLFAGVLPEDLGALRSAISDLTATAPSVEVRWQHPTGRIVWTMARHVPVLDHFGRLIGIHGVLVDISAKRSTEESRVMAGATRPGATGS